MNVFIPFLIMFVPILLVFGIIDYFSYKSWTSVFIALNDEDYFKAVSKLKLAGIRYKTKSLFNQTTTPMFGGNRQREFEIYVKEQDVNSASHKLNS